jgi:2-keto-4-pentenoate hydratase
VQLPFFGRTGSSARASTITGGRPPRRSGSAYATQRDIVARTGQPIVGWKIAATSAAGQKHIGVDGPLAGPLVGNIVFANGATIPLDGNVMKVAEAEFAFKFGKALPRREAPYTQIEVFDAVESLHTAIEVPDSRYNDFAKVGANQLIADTACSCWFILGPATKGRLAVARPRRPSGGDLRQ